MIRLSHQINSFFFLLNQRKFFSLLFFSPQLEISKNLGLDMLDGFKFYIYAKV
jgi:hypothetical protein